MDQLEMPEDCTIFKTHKEHANTATTYYLYHCNGFYAVCCCSYNYYYDPV